MSHQLSSKEGHKISRMDFEKIQMKLLRFFAIWFFYSCICVSTEKVWNLLKRRNFELPVIILGISVAIYHYQFVYENCSLSIITGIPDYLYEGNRYLQLHISRSYSLKLPFSLVLVISMKF